MEVGVDFNKKIIYFKLFPQQILPAGKEIILILMKNRFF
jgi:hypothetical protein